MPRPPIKQRTPIKCAGPYVGLGDPATDIKDWDEIGKWLYDHDYNQLSLFLTLDTPNKFYPWPRQDGKYIFTQINQNWFSNLRNCIDRLAYWRITPKLKFVDAYHDSVLDPFVQGLGHDNTEALYSSWDGSKYRWLKWDEPTPRHYVNFKPTSIFGEGMCEFISKVIDTAKGVKESQNQNGHIAYPDFRICLCWANETRAVFHAGESHPYKTVGDRDEIDYFILGLAKDAGFKLGRDLLYDKDYLAYRPDIRTVDYGTMAKVSVNLANKGQRLEIHGIMSVADIDKYVANGVVAHSCLFSTDGDLKMNAQYNLLGRSKYHTDLKIDAKPGEPIYPTNFMKFWRSYSPRAAEYVKFDREI